jgi:cyanophycin synthetase
MRTVRIARPAARRYHPAMPKGQAASLVELRVLDGPNLYFTRPAVKLTVAVPGWLGAGETKAANRATATGMPGMTGAGAKVSATANGQGRARLRPGEPRTEQRARFVARLAAHLTRSLAEATGTELGVRGRAGPTANQVVVAYPWRRRIAAEAFGREVVVLIDAAFVSRKPLERLIDEAAARLTAVEPGPPPTVPNPKVPVIAVTGTNGKTSSVRLIAHIARAAGKTVAYSSTDGVYLNGRLVEQGDYSGFGGAARAMAQPGVEIAILETARGGILLRGIGALHNDVAVVTNISADHLDLHGIRTIDQLAEVKATVTKITRPNGWDVLNADDPRVLAMRKGARGRPWLISLDHQHPALRQVLNEGGRGMTVIDRWMTVLESNRDPRPLIAMEDVPMTLAGISSHNVHNALGAAAAGLGIGLPQEAVVRGLRTFVLDAETNPGRLNLFELNGRVIVIDYAHNEAGMHGLVETSRGLRAPGAEVWLSFCTAGDRTPDILHALGYAAARGSDHVGISEMPVYLRGRDRQDLIDRLTAGCVDGGATRVAVYPSEVRALGSMLRRSKPRDVVAVTALSQRAEVFAYLKSKGARRIGPSRVRQLVRRART